MIQLMPLALLQADRALVMADQLNSENFQFGNAVYLGPVLVLVAAVLLIMLCDICVRALKIRRGLSMGASLTIGLLGALASGCYAAWFMVQRWSAETPLELFNAVG